MIGRKARATEGPPFPQSTRTRGGPLRPFPGLVHAARDPVR
jgi:hypothetical protein